MQHHLRSLWLVAVFSGVGLIRPADAATPLSGTVTSSSGTPIPADELQIEAEGMNVHESGRVPREGQFEFSDLAPGRYRIRISAPGYLAQELTVVLPDGGPARLNVQLLPLAASFAPLAPST